MTTFKAKSFCKKSLSLILLLVFLFLTNIDTYSATDDTLFNKTSTPQSLQAATEEGQWGNVSSFVPQKNGFTTAVDDKQSTQQNQTDQSKDQSKQGSEPPSQQFLQLQQLVIQMSKDLTQLQQQTQESISRLNQNSFELSERVRSLEQVLQLINLQIKTLAEVKSSSSNKATNSLGKTVRLVEKYHSWLLFIAIFLLIALLFIIVKRVKKRAQAKKESATNKNEDASGEYDFMGTKDAIPAKFDLVNAYIEMENFEEAKKVLEDIIKMGNKEQKSEAEKILANIQKQK